MRLTTIRQGLLLGLALAVLSSAPSPPEKPKPKSALAVARFAAATKQFDETWTFYRQSRTESFPVYYWSRLVLDSQVDLNEGKADRIVAHEAHIERMRKLEALVNKVRKLGFGFSVDVKATEYYRIEAERWLEKLKAE